MSYWARLGAINSISWAHNIISGTSFGMFNATICAVLDCLWDICVHLSFLGIGYFVGRYFTEALLFFLLLGS